MMVGTVGPSWKMVSMIVRMVAVAMAGPMVETTGYMGMAEMAAGMAESVGMVIRMTAIIEPATVQAVVVVGCRASVTQPQLILFPLMAMSIRAQEP